MISAVRGALVLTGTIAYLGLAIVGFGGGRLSSPSRRGSRSRSS